MLYSLYNKYTTKEAGKLGFPTRIWLQFRNADPFSASAQKKPTPSARAKTTRDSLHISGKEWKAGLDLGEYKMVSLTIQKDPADPEKLDMIGLTSTIRHSSITNRNLFTGGF